MTDRELVFYDEWGALYQPVKHYNRTTGRSAYRVKPRGATNRTDDFLDVDTVEEVARAMLVEGLPARVKALAGGPVSVLRYGADLLRRYELDPAIAAGLGVPAASASSPSTRGATTSRAARMPLSRRRSAWRSRPASVLG